MRGISALRRSGRYACDKVSLDGTSVPCVVDVYALCIEEESAKWRKAATRARSRIPLETASMLAYEEGLSKLLAALDHNLLGGSLPALRRKKTAKR